LKKPESPPVISFPDPDVLDFLKKNEYSEKFQNIEREEYPYWEDLKYKIKSWNYSPEKIWNYLKFQRRFNFQKLTFSGVPEFEFRFSVPPLLQKYLHQLDLNLGGFLEGSSIIPAEEKNRYLISSIMEEAISSSQLEGAATTRKVAKEMLEKQLPPKNHSEKMILNNYQTMNWIVKNQQEEFTLDTLLSIHKIITKDTLDDPSKEGRLRDNNNIKVMDETNEIFYTPPDYSFLPQLLKDFCFFANDGKENEFIHPIIRGIILHFLIGYIHPFVDGNGRTARAVFYWYLLKKGYWLIEYMSISRIILRAPSQYARAYLHTEYDENDLTYFLLYNVKAMHLALDDLKKYIKEKTEERKKTVALISAENYNERQIIIIKDLLKNHEIHFTVKQIETKFGISNQTARSDLAGLQRQGILDLKMTGNRAQFIGTKDFEKKLKLKH